jgi:hypothetical protein
MCTEKEREEKMHLLREIDKKLGTIEKKPAIDRTLMISTTQPYVVDFKNRKHLFVWSANALTILLEDLGTLAVAANTWTNIGYQEGMRLVPQSQPTTVPIFVRATDETIP